MAVVRAASTRDEHMVAVRATPVPRVEHSPSASPKKTPKKKLPQADESGGRICFEESVTLESPDDVLAHYRAASAKAATSSDPQQQSKAASSQLSGPLAHDELKAIFKAMDLDGDGVVHFSEIRDVIAMAHSSGGVSSASTPRRTGGASPSPSQPQSSSRQSQRRGPLQQSQPPPPPANAVALTLPEEFTLDVWLSEMARMSSEINVLGLFECFRGDTGSGAAASSSSSSSSALSDAAGVRTDPRSSVSSAMDSSSARGVGVARMSADAAHAAVAAPEATRGAGTGSRQPAAQAPAFSAAAEPTSSYLDAMGCILRHADSLKTHGAASAVCRAWING